MSNEPLKCWACGAEQAPDARFCSTCGKALGVEAEQTVPLAPVVAPPPVAAPPPPPVAAPPPAAPTPPPFTPPGAYGAPAPAYLPPPRKSPAPMIALVLALLALALVVAFGGAYLALRSATAKQEAQAKLEAASTQTTAPSAAGESTTGGEAKPSEEESQPAPDQVKLPAENEPLLPGKGAAVANADAAIDLVMKRADIQEWVKQVEAAQAEGKKRTVNVEVTEETDEAYVVHVYETVADEEPGHTATFGWYNVNKATGDITDANKP